jgi:hypothetical protein
MPGQCATSGKIEAAQRFEEQIDDQSSKQKYEPGFHMVRKEAAQVVQ